MLIIVVGISCKKEAQTFRINGNVYDSQLKCNVQGATVILLGNKVESGVFNNNFTELARSSTDASGNYNFEIKDQKVAAYKFTIIKDKYFDLEAEVKTDVLQASENFTKNFIAYPQATIQIHTQNTSPQGTEDQIKWRFLNADQSCKTCCNSLWTTGIGPTYNQTTECMVVGARYLNIEWVVTKNGSQHIYMDSIFMNAFQTQLKEISY